MKNIIENEVGAILTYLALADIMEGVLIPDIQVVLLI